MTDGTPEFVEIDELKFVTNLQIAVTVDGLILTFHCVEAAQAGATPSPKPVPLKFLLSPEAALAVGNELARRAGPLIRATKQ